MNFIDELIKNPSQINTFVGIFYWGRSGSYFLQSLLDYHPEVLSLPIRSWEGYYRHFHTLTEKAKELSSIKFAELTVFFFPFFFQENNKIESQIFYPKMNISKLGENKNIPMGIKKETFIRILSSIITQMKNIDIKFTNSLIINIIHIAYAKSQDRIISSPNPLILMNIHGYFPEIMKLILKDYKICKFIVTVRLPEKGHDALVSHCYYDIKLNNHITTYYNSLDELLFSDSIPSFVPINIIKCIKFEDFHTNTENTMKILCKWLKINFNEILLKSTLDGKLWWYTKNGIDICGTNIDIRKNDYKLNCLSFFDVLKIRYLFQKNYVEWGYKNHKIINSLPSILILLLSLIFPIKIQVNSLFFNLRLNFKKFIEKKITLHSFLDNCKRFLQIFLIEHIKTTKRIKKELSIRKNKRTLFSLLKD